LASHFRGLKAQVDLSKTENGSLAKIRNGKSGRGR